jgi:hypothetical protein
MNTSLLDDAKLLIDFVNKHDDLYLENNLTFESLGGFHLELHSKPPHKTLAEEIESERFRTEGNPKRIVRMNDKNPHRREKCLYTEQQENVKRLDKIQKQLQSQEFLSLKGEELWNSKHEEERNLFARNLSDSLTANRCISVYGDAGHGKSFIAKEVIALNPDWRTYVINPYHHLIQSVWKSDKWIAMTDYRALGVKVEEGEAVKNKCTMPFDKCDLLIIDEVFLISMDNLTSLSIYIKRNPNMKVLILGDPFQNESVNKVSNNVELMKPYFEFLAEAVRVICPKYITMEYNKRNPSDALKLSKIKHQLFTEKKTTMEVFQYLKDNNIIGGVINHKENLQTSGIDTHITYKNNYSIDLNRYLHTEVFKQKDEFVVCDGSFFVKHPFLNYKVGNVCTPTICNNAIVTEKGTIDYADAFKIWSNAGEADKKPSIEQLLNFLLHERGVYLLRCRLKGFFINENVRLSILPKSKKKTDQFTFINHDGEALEINQSIVTHDNFRYNYCRTGHSCQGDTITKRFCIHMYESEFLCNKRWFWTAITRSVSLKNVYIHLVKDTDPTPHDFHCFASRKLESYKQIDQDKKQNNEEYDLCKMKAMLKNNYGKQCYGLMDRACDNMMSLESNSPDSLSFDRINNSRGHGIDNIRIRCLSCNRMAKDLDDKL